MNNNNHKWKKIGSVILAVCLVLTLLAANQSVGVLAEEDSSRVEEQKNQIDASNQSDAIVKTQKNNEQSRESRSADIEKEASMVVSENKETISGERNGVNVATQRVEDIDVQSADAEISETIDADETLLEWKCTKEASVSISIGNQSYTVTDDESYMEAYTAVCEKLNDLATLVSNDISVQTISNDTVWNISNTVNMNGTVTVAEGARLVILGNGTILRSGAAYGIHNSGKLMLQGSVYLNGNGLNGTLISMSKGVTYLTDDFHIGNCPDATGVVTSGGTLEMSGGLVGTRNITFEWKDENDNSIGNKNYEESLTYIENQINSGRYDYVSDITATDGCKRGIQIGSQSEFYMSGGEVAGNIGSSGLYLAGKSSITDGMIFGNVMDTGQKNTSQGGAIDCINASSIQILGGRIYANHAAGYGGAINVGNGTVLGKNLVLAYNSAQYNGGAVVVNAKKSVSVQDNAKITHNTAIGMDWVELSGSGNGGAFRVVGTLKISGGTISYNYANGKGKTNLTFLNSGNGGAISAQTDSDDRIADIGLFGGYIEHNKSRENGGAIWSACMIDSLKTTFRLEGTIIRDNIAGKQGGGAYLAARRGNFTADIISGELSGNSAGISGGGMYLELGDVNGYLGKSITVNIGKQGDAENNLLISDNSAKENGGALYVGRSEINTSESNTIDVNLYSGTLKSNSADKGGGLGIIQGALNLYGGTIIENTATTSGGGAYLAGGTLTINGGAFGNNTAINGGGAYLAGGTLTINGGAFSSNTATNGGGAYAADGKVRMFGGNITNNTATQDGGGFYVSSEQQAADVIIRSGTMSGNKAGAGTANAQGNGGAIAVVSTDATSKADHVVLGVLETHKDLNASTHTFTSFTYTDTADHSTHMHASCPAITGNQATGNGGGVYMNSSAAILDVYCLQEDNNTAQANTSGGSVMATGGTVNIGDKGHNDENARGNISVKSPMLVSGGTVEISGNMDNPYFAGNILVDIKANAGSFTDYRKSTTTAKEYKIHYFENFKEEGSDTPTGAYEVKQYSESASISAEGAMFAHPGYKIVSWNTKADGSGTEYKIGASIGNASDHTAWQNREGSSTEDDPLILYAIWQKISYTVSFDPNSTSYTGEMVKQEFTYGEERRLLENPYKVTGKRFLNWNTKADGSGIQYEANYSESKMLSEDGQVTLYAQWVDCTHKGGEHPGNLSYTVNSTAYSITESCDCGGHTAVVSISASNVYADGKEHLAKLSVGDGWLAGNPTITYTYSDTKEGTYGDLPAGTTVPTQVGFYKASITVDEKTVSVNYEIKSPAATANIDVTAMKGQQFDGTGSGQEVSVASDDAFTVLFQVDKLNELDNSLPDAPYVTAPVLSFGQNLPVGTTIIMQTGGTYWYNVVSTASKNFELNSFTKMGGTETNKFAYPADIQQISSSQSYRFIVDFSDVSLNDRLTAEPVLNVKLTYKNKNSSTSEASSSDLDLSEAINVTISNPESFSITPDTTNNGSITVTAPAETANTKWENRSLVMVVSPTFVNSLPKDAKLTVSTIVGGTSKTDIYQMDTQGNFVIPYQWSKDQKFTFKLDSQLASAKGQAYDLNVNLYAGNMLSNPSLPKAKESGTSLCSTSLNVSIPSDSMPSLKISGTQRIFSKSESLKLDITYQNIDNATVQAVIQKKTDTGYNGTFLSTTGVNNGTNTFTLNGITDSGSYRLLITVTKDNKTVLSVPYYFIVK